MPPQPLVHIVEPDAAVRDALVALLRAVDLPSATYESLEALRDANPRVGCIVAAARGDEPLAGPTPLPLILTGRAADTLRPFAVVALPYSADEILAAIRAALG